MARKCKHGMAMTPTWFAWRNMRNRCRAPIADPHGRYLARGITVCARWQTFANFLEDMGVCPPGLELDRVDNDLGYDKANCRWTTKTVNRRNTHRAKTITWQGRTQHFLDWAAELNINPETLRSRVFRHGWPIEKAFNK